MSGSRKDIPKEQVDFYLNNGFSIVAVDYRLAPTTPLSLIAEDVQDAITWVSLNRLELKTSSDDFYLIGHSAGGYLSILAGNTMHPKPKAIVSIYGYGDILDNWANTPDHHYLQMEKLEENVALSSINDSITTNELFSRSLSNI